MSSAKLYVGNLSYETSEASIRTAFEAQGEVVSVNLITDRDTGRPKGFGFVEMGSAEDAQKAKGALDGTQLDGRAFFLVQGYSSNHRTVLYELGADITRELYVLDVGYQGVAFARSNQSLPLA